MATRRSGFRTANEDGLEAAVRIRYRLTGKKRFRWQTGSKMCLYGLDRLADARKAGFVILVEGESDCHTLWHHGIPALGLPGNTQWNEARDAPLLADISTIYVVVEPDQGGKTMLKRFAGSSILTRVRLVRLGIKDPSAVHIALEGEPDRFRTAFRAAFDASEPYPETGNCDAGGQAGAEKAGILDAAEITRLAALSSLDYERQREGSAEQLKCRVTTLDRLVADARACDTSRVGQGRPLELYEPQPWPEPVDGAELLNAIVTDVRRYVVLDEAETDAVALWILAVHVFDLFFIFPRLFITAPEKGCGKTTLLDVIGLQVPRKVSADNITAAALFRTIEAARPTLLLDEADTYTRDNEDLRAVRSQAKSRVANDYEPRPNSTQQTVLNCAVV
jgi:hypothetical protein